MINLLALVGRLTVGKSELAVGKVGQRFPKINLFARLYHFPILPSQ